MSTTNAMPTIALIEDLVQRDRAIALAALLGVGGLTAAYTVCGVGMDMSALQMTAMPNDMLMAPAVWTLEYAALMFLMWWMMMIAMMLPSAAPAVLLYAAIKRRRHDVDNPAFLTTMFLSGYLVTWGLFSVLAAALQWALEGIGLLSAMMNISSQAFGGLILIGTGIYQITPFKQACLQQCREPIRLLVGRPQLPGLAGALRLGLRHGAYCVGCCALLMILLFFGGVMNLFWIAGLAMFVLLEKLLPYGRLVGHAAGIVLLSAGVLYVFYAASPS